MRQDGKRDKHGKRDQGRRREGWRYAIKPANADDQNPTRNANRSDNRPGQRAPHREPHHDPDGPVRIFGIHAVEAALHNPARKILRLALTENAERRLAETLASHSHKHDKVEPHDLDLLLGGDTVHQGALLEAEPLPEQSLDTLAERAQAAGPLVVLDQVTDPHNVGAILRSAAAFGASGLIMTRRNSPPLSGTLAKSASGALEHIPVALVPNLAQALGKLGDLGLTRIGLDGEAAIPIESEQLQSGIALVLGAEGKGLRRLTRDLCDRLCRITTAGPLQSLNVSNAAAIALHVAATQRAKT